MNEWEWQVLDEKTPLASVEVRGGGAAKPGDFVWLDPRPGGDIFDLALAGRMASVEAIEQDFDGSIQLAVVVDADPGKDLGLLRQPGHRFFFKPEEVTRAPRILVAGIGNIFFGDDAFGVEVVRRMRGVAFPGNVEVVDFGIRGFDLACALIRGYDLSILIDACPLGAAPGTVRVLEPNLAEYKSAPDFMDVGPHGLTPASVLRLAGTMDGTLGKVLVVGCEPMNLGGEEGWVGLSEPVDKAAAEAIETVSALVAGCLRQLGPARG
jgi:hydrogenase maturation protease